MKRPNDENYGEFEKNKKKANSQKELEKTVFGFSKVPPDTFKNALNLTLISAMQKQQAETAFEKFTADFKEKFLETKKTIEEIEKALLPIVQESWPTLLKLAESDKTVEAFLTHKHLKKFWDARLRNLNEIKNFPYQDQQLFPQEDYCWDSYTLLCGFYHFGLADEKLDPEKKSITKEEQQAHETELTIAEMRYGSVHAIRAQIKILIDLWDTILDDEKMEKGDKSEAIQKIIHLLYKKTDKLNFLHGCAGSLASAVTLFNMTQILVSDKVSVYGAIKVYPLSEKGTRITHFALLAMEYLCVAKKLELFEAGKTSIKNAFSELKNSNEWGISTIDELITECKKMFINFLKPTDITMAMDNASQKASEFEKTLNYAKKEDIFLLDLIKKNPQQKSFSLRL
jgi:hypothetical protein